MLVNFEVGKMMCENLDYLGLPVGSQMVIFRLKSGLPVVSHVDYQKCKKHHFQGGTPDKYKQPLKLLKPLPDAALRQ